MTDTHRSPLTKLTQDKNQHMYAHLEANFDYFGLSTVMDGKNNWNY